ncbi:hypothetical protein [Neisseria meningitidis]|nr:hypothetical protein [Neisseria meningitidis]
MPSETANGIQTASSSTVIPAQAGIQRRATAIFKDYLKVRGSRFPFSRE